MLEHYVFLKYREGTSAEHVASFCERMLALRDSIGQIRRLDIGCDELHDARSWDLVLIMAFDSVEALRAYQAHPEHVALMSFNDRYVRDVASVDFTDRYVSRIKRHPSHPNGPGQSGGAARI
jgi:hypothetical protein